MSISFFRYFDVWYSCELKISFTIRVDMYPEIQHLEITATIRQFNLGHEHFKKPQTMKKNLFFINFSLSYLKKGICSTLLAPPVIRFLLSKNFRGTSGYISLNFKEGIISIDGGLLSKAVRSGQELDSSRQSPSCVSQSCQSKVIPRRTSRCC